MNSKKSNTLLWVSLYNKSQNYNFTKRNFGHENNAFSLFFTTMNSREENIKFIHFHCATILALTQRPYLPGVMNLGKWLHCHHLNAFRLSPTAVEVKKTFFFIKFNTFVLYGHFFPPLGFEPCS